MRVGIICAGDREVAPFLPVIHDCKMTEKAMLKFYEGKISDVEVVVLFAGVCKVNAVIATQILIDTYHVNRIIIKTPYNEMFSVANNIKKVLKELCDKLYVIGPTYSKQYGGGVLIVKHNYSKINDVYKAVYERYQNSQTVIIFDKYPRKL